MKNFVFENPTKVIFGQGQVSRMGAEVKKHAQRVLMVYGGGSIKNNGVYDQVTGVLREHGITWVELAGVRPNPRIDSVREGVALCRENHLDMVLAVGGGSVVDCAKVIAAGVNYDKDPWDFFEGKAKIREALPVGVVLTLAATGSEMNVNAVISNDTTKEKKGIASNFLLPKFAVLDPTYTYTVPPFQTAAGIADIMSHVFEQYFSANHDAYLQDRMCEAVLKTCIYYGPVACSQPENYEARANLMWASTIGLNGILSVGKLTDWATHMIEHEVSALYDVTHGAGLAILTPHWMEYVLDEPALPKFAHYAHNVWGITGDNEKETALAGIERTRKFFQSLGLPTRLRDVGVEEPSLELMAERAVAGGTLGRFKKLGKEDVLEILRRAF